MNRDNLKAQEHICWFTPSAGGGHARYTQELLRALAKNDSRGDRTFELVTSVDVEGAFADESLPYAISPILPALKHRDAYLSKFHWIVGRLSHYPLRERAFLKWLAMRPDITAVHLQEWTPWLAASFVRSIQRLGKRVYYTVHNVYPHRYPPGLPKAMMHRWLRTACLACDGLFVLTKRLREQLEAFLATASHPPITVAPHGIWSVELGADRKSVVERGALKKLLFFGAIRQNKGLHLLLDAMKHLPDYSLTIAGAPLEQDYFSNQILPAVESLKHQGASIDLQARFIGDDELKGLFASHSAVALPYTAEFNAQSGVIFMAMAHDMPVIASEAGGMSELFAEFKIGATFRDRTAKSFAAAVRTLEGPSVLANIETQLAAARQHYSWDAAAAATLKGYPKSSIPEHAKGEMTPSHDRTVQANPAH